MIRSGYVWEYKYVHTHIHKHVKTISEKGGHGVEGEQGRAHGSVWKKLREGKMLYLKI